MRKSIFADSYIKWLFVAGLIFRVAWVLMFNVSPASDYAWYYHTANYIYSGVGYAYYNTPTAYWPIGYPLYLAGLMFLFRANNLLILLVNVLLSLYIITRCIRIAEITGVPLKGIRLLTALLMFYLNQIAYTNLFCSELPFLALFLWYCVYVLKHKEELNTKQNIFAGIALGAAIVIKPIVLFFPLLMFVRQIYRLQFRKVIVQYAVIALCILPLTLRNYAVFGEPILISLNMPVNLFIGNNPYANGTYVYDEQMQKLLGNPVSELEESKRASAYALNYIYYNPIHVLSLIPLKIYHQYLTDVDGISSNIAGMKSNDSMIPLLKMLRWAAQFYYVVLGFLFFTALILFVKKHSLKKLFGSFHIKAILYFFILYLPFFGAPRFHFVMMPFVIMFIVSCIPLFNRSEHSRKLQG